jgi:hypothetical protein
MRPLREVREVRGEEQRNGLEGGLEAARERWRNVAVFRTLVLPLSSALSLSSPFPLPLPLPHLRHAKDSERWTRSVSGDVEDERTRRIRGAHRHHPHHPIIIIIIAVTLSLFDHPSHHPHTSTPFLLSLTLWSLFFTLPFHTPSSCRWYVSNAHTLCNSSRTKLTCGEDERSCVLH